MNSRLKYVLPLVLSFAFLPEAYSAVAFENIPTLNKIKQKGTTYKVVSPFVLQATQVAGYRKVLIGGVTYYFDAGDDNLARVLSNTSAGNLVLTNKANAAFKYGENYYAFDVASLPVSSFNFVESTSSDYNFITKEVDNSNNVTNKYYKIVLNVSEFADSSRVSWEEVGTSGADTITVKLPNNKIKYFKYTYTPAVGRTVYMTPQSALNGNVDADFKDSFIVKSVGSADCTGSYACGGAIYNNIGATIGNITGDFVGNYTNASASWGYGGAILNGFYTSTGSSIIGDITGNFIGNYSSSDGGAIANISSGSNGIKSAIGDIIGNFIGNHGINGGAIFGRNAQFGNITGDFIGNYVASTMSSTSGGAIYNYDAQFGNVTGDFIGNYASSTATSSAAFGGAIYNFYSNAVIGDITGNFIRNYISGVYTNGGAIGNQNGATIGNITGDFIENYANSTSTSGASGGAIFNAYNNSSIGDVKGNFIENYVVSNSNTYGGAIYNQNSIMGKIEGNFIGNYASGSGSIYGGAIYNSYAIMSKIEGDFIGNYASGSAYGGAIYNQSSTIENIIGNFIGNYILGFSASGSAIYGGY
ncbi:MAG: hypothetical protein ACK5N8_01940 [Alphaproteobacteria bacterium]